MRDNGEVAEWFKAAVLKTAECNSSVSSNLTFSANYYRGLGLTSRSFSFTRRGNK
jgi:hypothetical protein